MRKRNLTSKEEEHQLQRCVFSECNLINRLQHPMRDFNHVEELCVQSYMDVLGYGINQELIKVLEDERRTWR